MRKQVLIAVGAITLIGLLNFSIVMTSWRAESNGTSAKYPFVWEMTGAYTALVLLPLPLYVVRNYPIGRRNWRTRLPLHIATFFLFAVTQTLLMWGSREVIYWILGWGRYDYGDMHYRFFMEGQKQLVCYVAFYCLMRFIAYARANRERERELTEAKLSALKMQLQPHFLFNALNMISSVGSPGTELEFAL